MSAIAPLRSRAEALAAPFPALLAGARHLAASMAAGSHGRRRPGQGDEFWQYRAAQPGDELRAVDWRRSGRSDTHFVRQKEWQAAQSVSVWVDPGQSMRFASRASLPRKADRAAEIALAASVLLIHGGERVGLNDHGLPPRGGEVQLMRMAQALERDLSRAPEYGVPNAREIPPGARALFLSDFLGDIDGLRDALTAAADRGISGALVQVLDPAEEAFPFDGRTIFESMGGSIRHETLKAGDLRDRYLDRLAARKDALRALCAAAGWQYTLHHTGQPAAPALLWLYAALERVA
ncbi:DUF58 domain-containing protein [Palleronia sediminis]|uniref:DUF58 domain-containing protein n=1 Tax=Palleronia sediminis TaxID=2547833 RepID=A0A4R6AAB4_9RHOB|nr:DUF58 domain-containing protein [Palleronia sediminis]TDL79812.1 DUF58 domain-containing protein [Palleronia sediminis]